MRARTSQPNRLPYTVIEFRNLSAEFSRAAASHCNDKRRWIAGKKAALFRNKRNKANRRRKSNQRNGQRFANTRDQARGVQRNVFESIGGIGFKQKRDKP